MKRLISIDVGSTWTKGAVFDIDACSPGELICEETTVDDLALGFGAVLGRLRAVAGDVPVYWSSSAKGGLGMVAIGLVPELTVEAARATANSAGGKLLKAYSFRLTPEDVAEIRGLRPDIILITGGTDGGNESYQLANARLLASSGMGVPVLYAGNRAIAETIRVAFGSADVRVADNVMPDLGLFNPEPAREMIREIFLEKIAAGKGLESIRRIAGRDPKPTPLAVYELTGAIRSANAGLGDFMAIDMGGATTDVYSAVSDGGGESVIRRGLSEPEIKRTVEGDLGMRVSARHVRDVAHEYLRQQIPDARVDASILDAYADDVAGRKGYVPSQPAEVACDRLLASACLYHSLLRHSGRIERFFTSAGETFVARGRDLRRVRTIIGSGGYLSRCNFGQLGRQVLQDLREGAGKLAMLPAEPEFRRDAKGLFPLLGNLAEALPREAAAMAIAGTVPGDEIC
jgi:uncharacterized protein (TIGR01319 family)